MDMISGKDTPEMDQKLETSKLRDLLGIIK